MCSWKVKKKKKRPNICVSTSQKRASIYLPSHFILSWSRMANLVVVNGLHKKPFYNTYYSSPILFCMFLSMTKNSEWIWFFVFFLISFTCTSIEFLLGTNYIYEEMSLTIATSFFIILSLGPNWRRIASYFIVYIINKAKLQTSNTFNSNMTELPNYEGFQMLWFNFELAS